MAEDQEKNEEKSGSNLSHLQTEKSVNRNSVNRLTDYIPSLSTSIQLFFFFNINSIWLLCCPPSIFFLFLTFSISIQFDCIRLFTYVIDFINGFLCFLAHHIKRSLFDRIVRVQFPHSFSLVNEYHTKYYFQFSFLKISWNWFHWINPASLSTRRDGIFPVKSRQ